MRIYLGFYGMLTAATLLSIGLFRSYGHRREMPCFLAALVSAMGLLMWHWSDPPIQFIDFTQAYYPAGRAILQDVSRLYERISACEATAICGFVNIPIIALLFSPLSVLSLNSAHVLFALLSLIGVMATICMIWFISDARPPNKYVIVLLFVINGPLFYSLKEGNLTHFVLLLLVAGVLCLDKKRDGWAGFFFAMAAIIKLPLLLFAGYFLTRGRWEVVRGYCSTLVGVCSVSLLYAGWSSHVEWYREAILPFVNKGLSAFNVQSIDAFLLRLGDDARLYDWRPSAVDWEFRLLRHSVAAALLGISWLLCKNSPGRDDMPTVSLELSMVLCVALIISPVSWTHYYLLLLLPLSLYAGQKLAIPSHGGWLVAIIVCVLLISPPVTFVSPTSWLSAQIVNKFLVSHYLGGAMLLWFLLGYARLREYEAQDSRVAWLPDEEKAA
ncbi:glycosyltransferase family 87 protein [Nitrospira sp. Nam80]